MKQARENYQEAPYDPNSRSESQKSMTIIILVVAIVVGIFSYYVGVGNGEKASLEITRQDYTDEDYLAAEACYKYVINTIDEINGIAAYGVYDADYELLASKMSDIQDLSSGVTYAVPDGADGHYNCSST